MSQLRNHRRANRRSGVIFFLCLVALATALIATTGLTSPWFHYAPPAAEPETPSSPEFRTGTIVRQMGDEQCAIAKFDNDTGQVIDATGCKSNTVLDAHGVPVPMGTMHRLDSISKSFLGAAH